MWGSRNLVVPTIANVFEVLNMYCYIGGFVFYSTSRITYFTKVIQ